MEKAEPTTFDADVLQLLLAQRAGQDAPQAATTSLALPTIPYTPQALITLLLGKPGLPQAQYAAAFGRGVSWLSSVLASAQFQVMLDPHRHLIADPAITANMEERFRALAMQSLAVLQQKLEGPEVSDFLATKAAELSVKALGMGQVAPVTVEAPRESGAEAVATRIMEAMAAAKARTNAKAEDAVIITESPGNGT